MRESPFFQEILQEGIQEGLEKGREEERKEQAAALRQTVIDIVSERFPKLARFASKQTLFVDDPALLRHLIFKLSLSQTQAEARQYLQEIDKDEEEDEQD
jgi:flagellar biosynthesis/type III secretory pathway protein FliH